MNTEQNELHKKLIDRFLMQQWVELIAANIDITSWLVFNGYKTIAIYGANTLAKLLYEVLCVSAKIPVKYAIIPDGETGAYDFYGKLDTVSIADRLEPADIIIAAEYFDFIKTEKELYPKVTCPVIPISDIILELYLSYSHKQEYRLIRRKIRELSRADKIIIFLNKNKDDVNGGIMSICSLAETSRKFKDIHGAEVVLAALTDGYTLTPRYTKFNNNEVLIPYRLLLRSIKEHAKSIIIHIPEFSAEYFVHNMYYSEIQKIKNAETSTANIMNQNINQMQDSAIPRLREIFKKVTVTTAHNRYCTPEYREKYKVPLHHFSVHNIYADYVRSEYAQKENLLIYSPDYHPYKEKIINKIKEQFPKLKLLEIRGILFSDYLILCRTAKWSITFGEGLDGFFSEPALCGGCSFAVYNTDFFTENFKTIETVYEDYDTMYKKITEDIILLDNEYEYTNLNKSILDAVNTNYNFQRYMNNVKNYYLGDYTFK